MALTGIQLKAKRLFDLGLTAHSNQLVGAILTKYAATLPVGQTQTRMIQIATYVKNHPELCYKDFHAYFIDPKNGIFPDPVLMREIIKAVKPHKFVLRATLNGIRGVYPDVVKKFE